MALRFSLIVLADRLDRARKCIRSSFLYHGAALSLGPADMQDVQIQLCDITEELMNE